MKRFVTQKSSKLHLLSDTMYLIVLEVEKRKGEWEEVGRFPIISKTDTTKSNITKVLKQLGWLPSSPVSLFEFMFDQMPRQLDVFHNRFSSFLFEELQKSSFVFFSKLLLFPRSDFGKACQFLEKVGLGKFCSLLGLSHSPYFYVILSYFSLFSFQKKFYLFL